MLKFDEDNFSIWERTLSEYKEMEKAYEEHSITYIDWVLYCIAYLKKLMANNEDVLERLDNV